MDCEPTKSTAAEREFGEQHHGVAEWERSPCSRQCREMAKHHPKKSQSSQSCHQQSQGHLRGVLGRGKSRLVALCLQKASKLILAGWGWPRCSSGSPSAALGQCWGWTSKRTQIRGFSCAKIMFERLLKVQKWLQHLSPNIQRAIRSFSNSNGGKKKKKRQNKDNKVKILLV